MYLSLCADKPHQYLQEMRHAYITWAEKRTNKNILLTYTYVVRSTHISFILN